MHSPLDMFTVLNIQLVGDGKWSWQTSPLQFAGAFLRVSIGDADLE
jgi:hypothetical protein